MSVLDDAATTVMVSVAAISLWEMFKAVRRSREHSQHVWVAADSSEHFTAMMRKVHEHIWDSGDTPDTHISYSGKFENPKMLVRVPRSMLEGVGMDEAINRFKKSAEADNDHSR